MKLDWDRCFSWDHHGANQLQDLWNSSGSAASLVSGWETGNAIRNPAVHLITFRNDNINGIVIGFKYKPTTIGVDRLLIRIDTQNELRIDTAGHLYWRRGISGPPGFTSTGDVLVAGTWYIIEYGVYLHDSNGHFRVKRDGALEPNLLQTQQDTKGATGSFATSCTFDNGAGDFDEFYSRTGTGGVDPDDFFSDTNFNPRVRTLWPNGQGFHNEWINVTGGGNNYEELDEILHDGNSSYLQGFKSGGQATGMRDSWFFQDLPGNTQQFHALFTSYFVKRTGATAANYDPFLRIDGSNYDRGIPSQVDTTWQTGINATNYSETYWATNPDTGQDWTIGQINNIEAGIVRTDGFNEILITQAVLYVVYSTEPGDPGGGGGDPGEGEAPDFNLSISALQSFVLLDFFKIGSSLPPWKLTNANTDLDTKFGKYLQDPAIRVDLPTNSIGDLKRQIATIEVSLNPWLFAQELTSRRAVHPILVLVREREHGKDVDRTTLRFVGRVTRATRNPSGKNDIVKIYVGDLKNDLESSAGISENARCAWVFGNTKTCDIDAVINLNGLSEQGTVTLLGLSEVSIAGLGPHPNFYWRRGFVRRDGLDIRIRHWESGENFLLTKIPPLDWEGQTVDVFPGCDKRAVTCEFWQNLPNFHALAIRAPTYHPVFERPA